MTLRAQRIGVRGWLCLACLHLVTPLAFAERDNRFILIVSGLGGENYYSEKFRRWSLDLLDIAHQHYAIGDDRTTYLAEPTDSPDDRIDGVSRKSAVLEAIADLAQGSTAGDRVLLVFIGHGTAQGRDVHFNLPGPDLSPGELADALKTLQGRRLAVVNTAPASGPFVQALSDKERVVVTATADGHQSQATRFGGFFIDAMASDEADTDKNRQVSLLEAFNFARRQVELAYKNDGRLQPEHALLDDNGDGLGSRQPAANAVAEDDGALAGRFYLANPLDADAGQVATRVSLQREARRIVDRIEQLKREKRLFDEIDYETRLETLLVQLALNRRAYRTEQAP